MKQVVVIHGGDSFASYEEYIEALKAREVSLIIPKGWKSGLHEALGGDYEVTSPRMPNSFNARYEEWKIWFEKFTPLLNEEVILLGHSLGGVFLAKYLSSETYSKKVLGTLLVAAPFDAPDGSWDFVLTDPLDRFAQQGGKILLYQSKDDPIVSYSEVEKYHAKLPQSTVRSFDDRGHFDQEEFPELVADIKSLA